MNFGWFNKFIAHLFLFFALILFANHGWTQWYDTNTKDPRPDNDWRKTSGDLGAMLVITDDADAFLKEWYGTKVSDTPHIKTTDKAKRGGTVTALLFFSGCAPEGKSCDAKVDFKVLSPDGSVYADAKGYKVFSHPSPPKTIVALSEAQLRIGIESKDPLGIYSVIVEFHNPTSAKSIVLKQKFEVVR